MEYTIGRGGVTLTANSRGAELWSLKGTQEVIWSGEAWNWRAPVCCPWCGAVEDGWFEHGGRRYAAQRHGFVRELEHTLVRQGEDVLEFRLDWPGDGERWPWAFSFTTCHEITDRGAVTTCTLTNLSKEPMPAQLGFHPAFCCDVPPEKGVGKWFVRFEQREAPDRTDIFPLEKHTFDNDSICFEGLKSQWVQLEERDTGRFVRVATAGRPYVLLWSQPGVPGFVCIEPWTGYPGPGHNMACRPGVRLLAPGESLTGKQELTLGGGL